MSSMFDLDTSDLLLNFHGNYIPSKFVFTSDDRILYVGYAVDCLFKVTFEDFIHNCTILQGAESDWKTWGNGKEFSTVRENHTKYRKSPEMSDKCYLLF